MVVEPRLALSEHLYDAVTDLEYLDRAAWILTELRGLTTREAGLVLTVDHTTVHRRAERARAQIKEALA